MKEILVLRPAYDEGMGEQRLSAVLDYALKGRTYRIFRRPEEFQKFRREQQGESTLRVLFAVHLGSSGINMELFRWLAAMGQDCGLFDGCAGGVIVDGDGDLYTKSVGRQLVLAANACGCAFPGRPYVEGTGSLANFHIQAQNRNTDVMTAYCEEARDVVDRLMGLEAVKPGEHFCGRPRLLMLHASRPRKSNTYQLWSLAKEAMMESGVDVREISLRNGEVKDCRGCPYKACLHFGETGSCFYGGPMVDEVYPALKESQGLLMLCPNYNDAVDANLTAAINRLTALYRQVPFYDKSLFSIIVSGYSGSDIIGGQLVGALNMNKAFRLPSRYCVMATANDPGSAMKIPGIREKMRDYGRHAARVLKGEEI